MAEIRLEGLQKVFKTRAATVTAVKDLTLTFASSTVTCLLGPSGCGKTTLMRMIAGLETPSSGDIYFGDKRVTQLTPSERDIGMVFQYPVVYRGTDVYTNIELPLKEVRGLSKQARRARVDEVLDTLELAPHAYKSVDRLDNGTLQKVAVARAVARRPQIILFDEPITNVDAESKVQLKAALKNLTKQHSQTIVYVTHDQTEAMTLADDVALMRAGDIVQRGSPEEVYDHPNDRFGGWFLGNPGMNFVPHRVTDGFLQAPLFGEALRAEVGAHLVLVGVRPERVQVSAHAGAGAVAAQVTHRAVVSGGQHLLTLLVGGQTVKAKVPPSSLTAEQKVWVHVPKEAVTLFSEDGRRLETALA